MQHDHDTPTDSGAYCFQKCPVVRHSISEPCTEVMYFGATICNRVLSNFLSGCPVWVDGIQFSTTEHAYQSRLWPAEYRWWFGVDGPFNSFDSAVEVGFNFGLKNVNDIPKKVRWWNVKCKGAIGIIPKMLSNQKKDYYKCINFEGQNLPAPFKEHDLGDMSEDEFWMMILSQKFKDGKAKEFLMNTGSKTLVEFDKGARKHGSFWGAVYDQVTKLVHGYNYMGQMIMKVRDKMKGNEEM